MDRKTDRQTYRQMDIQTYGYIDRKKQTDGQISKRHAG